MSDACIFDERLEEHAKLIRGVTGTLVTLYVSDAARLLATSDRSSVVLETFARVRGSLKSGSTTVLDGVKWRS